MPGDRYRRRGRTGNYKGAHKETYGDDVHYLVVIFSQIYAHVRTREIAHSICMQFVVCKLYFDKPFGGKNKPPNSLHFMQSKSQSSYRAKAAWLMAIHSQCGLLSSQNRAWNKERAIEVFVK